VTRARFRTIPARGAHRPHGTTWALARGALHAIAPDPSAPGPMRGLEQEAAFHLQAAHAVPIGNATTALELLLGAMGLPPDAEVLLPALSEPWVPHAVSLAGLRPVPVEIDPRTLHLDPEALATAAGPSSAAVLVQHTAGVPADLDTLTERCAALGLPLVELFGAAIGASWRARPVGAIGLAGVAALEHGQLSTFGGALVTSDHSELVGRLRRAAASLPLADPMRVASRVARGHLRALLSHPSAFRLMSWASPGAPGVAGAEGYARMHPAQAEATRTAFVALEAQVDACRERAAQLRFALPEGAWRQEVPDGSMPAWSQLLVRTRDREGLLTAARDARIELLATPLTDHSGGACPVAAQAARECLALPCHRGLRDRDIERISALVEPYLL
jgi:dTDP-4-amino-4,6-dideoxygalactose transaminase